MTDADLFPFLAIFTTLTKVFPFRGDESETSDIGRAYFKTLRKFPFDLVKVGADNCMASMEKFPKPAEWAKHIPRRMPGPELAPLSRDDEREWRDAEKRGYEGDPCRCTECINVGVQHKPTRFVPDESEERAMMGDRVVLRGHWIHGDDLRRWYIARDTFWTSFHTTFSHKSIIPGPLIRKSTQQAIEEIFSKKNRADVRDPGEEG